MDKSYRINTELGSDGVLKVNLKQDVDLLKILSLEINNIGEYKKETSNYGIIVGRVLANEAFGIPNAKISVFIPLSEEDRFRSEIQTLYPYTDINSEDGEKKRYNLLKIQSDEECYTPVGTFPSKRMILDNDAVLEVYDKYWKYSTVTNKSGDYMIPGIPTGNTMLHVDIDLSDIGVLSQRPRDFIGNGYNINQFDSPTKFKDSNNLDGLPQVYSQNESVVVYPFWGDSEYEQISITRKDIEIQYDFKPSCVFLGCLFTDNQKNSISNNCKPETSLGDAGQLTTSEGTIEMIRKTYFDDVEEFKINGNQLIDSNGVWCYQIPMNLDYVGTDEFGNIVPTNNPNKGIPTRARVRFRVSLKDDGNLASSVHSAKYLIPNNPDISSESITPKVVNYKNDDYYEYGTFTPEECFRDLYWNKVYTVKSYIPRIQGTSNYQDDGFIGIKSVNSHASESHNPFPYNKLNLKFKVSAYSLMREVYGKKNSWSEIWNLIKGRNTEATNDALLERVSEDSDSIGLDFYNDWINGALYFPLWYRRYRQKSKYKSGEDVFEDSFCRYNSGGTMYLVNTCDLPYNNVKLLKLSYPQKSYYNSKNKGSDNDISYAFEHNDGKMCGHGCIFDHKNADNTHVYYYVNGMTNNSSSVSDYVRCFSTDIVMLGSLIDNDFDSIPQITDTYPSTTSNILPISNEKVTVNDGLTDDTEVNTAETEVYSSTTSYINGMNWGLIWQDNSPEKVNKELSESYSIFNNKKWSDKKMWYRDGVLFGFAKQRAKFGWSIRRLASYLMKRTDIVAGTKPKSCINVERLCELGVGKDGYYADTNNNISLGFDGLITRHELLDVNGRSLFATLNYNKLIKRRENKSTGYETYDLKHLYPSNFDGRMGQFIEKYTDGYSSDMASKDYLKFRFGPNGTKMYYADSGNYHFPLYDNSFYFFFGLVRGNSAMDIFRRDYFTPCKDGNIYTMKVDIVNYPRIYPCDDKSGRIKISSSKSNIASVEWSNNIESGHTDLTNANKYVIDNLYNGTYTVKVTDNYGNFITKKVLVSSTNTSMSIKTELEGNEYAVSIDCLYINGDRYVIDPYAYVEPDVSTNKLHVYRVIDTGRNSYRWIRISLTYILPKNGKFKDNSFVFDEKFGAGVYSIELKTDDESDICENSIVVDTETIELSKSDTDIAINYVPASLFLPSSGNSGSFNEFISPSWSTDYNFSDDEVGYKFNAIARLCQFIFNENASTHKVEINPTADGGEYLRWVYDNQSNQISINCNGGTKYLPVSSLTTQYVAGFTGDERLPISANNLKKDVDNWELNITDGDIVLTDQIYIDYINDAIHDYYKIPIIDRRFIGYNLDIILGVDNSVISNGSKVHGGILMGYDINTRSVLSENGETEYVYNDSLDVVRNSSGKAYLYNASFNGVNITERLSGSRFSGQTMETITVDNDIVVNGNGDFNLNLTSCSYDGLKSENNGINGYTATVLPGEFMEVHVPRESYYDYSLVCQYTSNGDYNGCLYYLQPTIGNMVEYDGFTEISDDVLYINGTSAFTISDETLINVVSGTSNESHFMCEHKLTVKNGDNKTVNITTKISEESDIIKEYPFESVTYDSDKIYINTNDTGITSVYCFAKVKISDESTETVYDYTFYGNKNGNNWEIDLSGLVLESNVVELYWIFDNQKITYKQIKTL